jgi:formate dehydrogenase
MPHHGMTPHYSGTTLTAQACYAAGTREILECWFSGRPICDEYLIVNGGELAGTDARSYGLGNATGARKKLNAFAHRSSCTGSEIPER